MCGLKQSVRAVQVEQEDDVFIGTVQAQVPTMMQSMDCMAQQLN